jgi:hypothetical protein
MTRLELLMGIAAIVILAGGIALPLWGIRRHSRMFPKGFDRTGWNPDDEDKARAGSVLMRITSLSGGGRKD